jgi:hypothetical protein
MSKVRDLPQINELEDNDLLYAVDVSQGPNGGRKITKEDLKTSINQSPAEIKTAYESNADTNAFTDDEKTKLAGIEAGARDQDASEVPFDGTASGLSATDVQAAIDEVAFNAIEHLRVLPGTGRIVNYSAGVSWFDGVFIPVPAGAVILEPNITLGHLYVDVDGIVKQTASGITPPPYTMPIARFTTNATSIVGLENTKARINQDLIRGDDSDTSTITPDAAADGGSTRKMADAGHVHAIATAAAVTQTPAQSNAAGASSSFARADHVHNIPVAAPSTDLDPSVSAAEGSADSFSRSDHTHAIATALDADITTIEPGASAGAGTADNYARGDHAHAIAAAAPATQTPDQANAEGASTSFARADHVHNIPAAAPSTTLTPAVSNAKGVAASVALSDHTHAIATALVGDITTIQPDASASPGTADTFARGDHRHAIAAAAPATQTPDQANAEGASTSFARADHVHLLATAAPVATGTANAQGASTSFARADHVHQTAIANSAVSATADIATVSVTDVLLDSMTLTPAAGTYLALFCSSTVNSGNGAERNYFSLYSGGVKDTGSERTIGISGGSYSAVTSMGVFTVNGSQAIEVRWRVIAGTGTTKARRLTLIRLA